MHWQFRKALESFDSYKRITSFKKQIQKGQENTLDMVVREIELILGDSNQKIIPKVLALRFIRDIMLLGKEEIIKKVQKILPQLTKICSFQLNSQDPDRGETYFHSHPTYIKLAVEQQKKQIDVLGSTFLILSLQSILHWAKWLPYDSLGQESIYSKAYKSLIERGVKFPTSFHYYKEEDSERFKNIYQMQHFTDAYDQMASQMPSEIQPSSLIQAEIIPPSSWQKKNQKKEENIEQRQIIQISGNYTGDARSLKTVNQIMNYLFSLKNSKTRKMGDLRQIYKQLQQTYQANLQQSLLIKEQKRWIQTYIINFSLLTNNIIDYNQFLKRSITQQIQLSGYEEEKMSHHQQITFSQNKPKSKSPVEGKKMNNEPKIGEKTQYLLKQQQQQYNRKIETLLLKLEEKNIEIQNILQNKQKDKNNLVTQYQNRINSIKKQVKKNQQEKSLREQEIEMENKKLKNKINQLEEELLHSHYNTSRERDIQTERNQLLTKVKKLQLENQKLIQLRSSAGNIEKNKGNLENQLKQNEICLQKLRSQLKRAQKQSKNYYDELAIYKLQLSNERLKHDQKIAVISKAKETLFTQNQKLKEKMLDLNKNLDVREIQILNLKEQVKRVNQKLREKELTLKFQNKQGSNLINRKNLQPKSQGKSKIPNSHFTQNGKITSIPKINQSQNHKLRFNNYEDLYNNLKPVNKQMYIRFCRCCLKKKDILFKQNELQIGIISELISQNTLKFIIHFTNTSEKSIHNLKIQCNISSPYAPTLDYQVNQKQINQIRPQQQEKLCITITNKQSPYFRERAIIGISYQKNENQFNKNIFLPFTIIKFFDFYKSKRLKIQQNPKKMREIIQIKYSKKMLPKFSSLKGYFQQIQQTQLNKYQMEAYHQQTDLSIQISFLMISQTQSMTIEALIINEKINEGQRCVFQQLISFIDAAFKK